MFTCSDATQQEIIDIVKEHDLDGIVDEGPIQVEYDSDGDGDPDSFASGGFEENPFYSERLEAVLRLGEAHWKAVDGKKSPSRRPERNSRGSR